MKKSPLALVILLLLICSKGFAQCPFPVTLQGTGKCPGSMLTVSTTDALSQIDWYNGTTLVRTATASAPVSGVSVAGNNGVGYGPDQLYNPNGIFVDAAGNVYVVDQMNNRVQKWAPGATSGVTLVGSSSTLWMPSGIFIDNNGYIYVADMGNHRVQKFPPNSNVNTVGVTIAGGNGQGYAANQLYRPRSVFVDAAGNVYVGDTDNYRVQKFPPGSTSATSGVTVAGGPSDPLGVAAAIFVDAAGNLYVSEPGYEQVRKWAPGATTGMIVAGGNGRGAAANQFNACAGIFVDAAGNLYVADEMNSRIQKWAPGATSGVTVAGGNGPGMAANQTTYPFGIWVDAGGNIYCSDYAKNSVQKWGQQPVIDKTHLAATAGTYTAVVKNSAGCDVTTNGIVVHPVVVPDVSVSASATTVCAGTPITFTATPVNGGTLPVYQWMVNGTSTGATGPSYTSNMLPNGAIVHATMASNENCPSLATVTSNTIPITVNALVKPSVSISAPVTTLCSGTSITFSVNAVDGGSNPAYQWQINGTNTGTNSTSYTTNGLADGDLIKCIMTSNANCATPATVPSNSIPVKVNASISPSVSLAAPATPICSGDLVSLKAMVSNGGNNASYQWQVNGVNTGRNSPDFSSDHFKDRDVVVCHYSSNGGCGVASSNSLPLTVHGLPTIVMGQSITIPAGQSTTLTPRVTGAVISYDWSPGATLSDSTILTPAASPTQTTQYTLVVTTAAGCQAKGDIVIAVLRKLRIPNAFTPNGDGHNDIFYVTGGPEGSRIKHFSIFNRWGQQIFQVQDVPPGNPAFGWNGYFKGLLAAGDTYVYMVTITFKDGTQQEFRGTVVLIK